MFSLALKEIRFFKLKYSLIAFILFLMASLVFIVSGLAQGLSNDNIAALEDMSVARFYLQEDAENRLDQSGYIIDELEEEIPREAGWQPLLTQMYRLDAASSETLLDVTLIPIDPEAFLYPGVIEGQNLTDSDALEIVADQTMKADGVEIGDTLYEADQDLTFTVVGFTENQTYRHSPIIYVAESAFYNLDLTPHQVANAIVIEEVNQELQADINQVLNDGDWVEKDAIIQAVPGHSSEQMSLMMMIAFLIVIAVFVLAAFFYILTIQKLNQFGVLKAIGAKNIFLVGATLLQVFCLTMISLILATGFTIFVSNILPEGMPFEFDLSLIASYSIIILIVSLLGSLLSSTRIVKVDPQQAMGRTE
ncbi:ABC transporter permease [Amphibacillus cookii]|uniref:ABC transporter permease n=1 Tax=Amphibacillus cookii TaxID=767787 RepID=UPI0019579227|nr:ABC transporter permease [Amphibacillus cookii]MBM7541610.1 putative ABC transport system permease protein [Amphibacillus cookii]